MANRRLICLCGTLLSKDEREHYLYQCSVCVTREHELILAHGRGDDHDEIDLLLAAPVDLGLQRNKNAQVSEETDDRRFTQAAGRRKRAAA